MNLRTNKRLRVGLASAATAGVLLSTPLVMETANATGVPPSRASSYARPKTVRVWDTGTHGTHGRGSTAQQHVAAVDTPLPAPRTRTQRAWSRAGAVARSFGKGFGRYVVSRVEGSLRKVDRLLTRKGRFRQVLRNQDARDEFGAGLFEALRGQHGDIAYVDSFNRTTDLHGNSLGRHYAMTAQRTRKMTKLLARAPHGSVGIAYVRQGQEIVQYVVFNYHGQLVQVEANRRVIGPGGKPTWRLPIGQDVEPQPDWDRAEPVDMKKPFGDARPVGLFGIEPDKTLDAWWDPTVKRGVTPRLGWKKVDITETGPRGPQEIEVRRRPTGQPQSSSQGRPQPPTRTESAPGLSSGQTPARPSVKRRHSAPGVLPSQPQGPSRDQLVG